MDIKNFERFKQEETINEEFIGSIVKGALGKLVDLFSAPFKDLSNDFKNLFKEEDPNSIKSVLLTNIDQAIDSAQKEITNIKEESAVLGIMDNMVGTLVQLANNIGKDVETALGKEKSAPVTELAKALLLGNKEADWVGVVGLLAPEKALLKKDINYKWSNKNFVDTVNKAKGLKEKQQAASKFLDNFQSDIKREIDKDLTEDEIKKLFDELKKKSGVKTTGMDYEKLKVLFDEKKPVIYLLKGKTIEDWNKLSDEQKKEIDKAPANTVAAKNVIDSLDDKNLGDSVKFKTSDGKTATKSYSQIIGAVEEAGNAKKAAEVLGDIKNDEDKMGKIVKFAEFIKKPENKDKVVEIEKILMAA